MKEGWWINTANNKFYQVFEHAHWAQDGDNAKKIVGLSKKQVAKLKEYNRHDDNGRYKILTTLMKKGWMRVRGHGNITTFEYWAPSSTLDFALYTNSIKRFLSDIGHDHELAEIYICNLKSKCGINVNVGNLQSVDYTDMQKVELYY